MATDRPTLAPIGLRLVQRSTRPTGKQKSSPSAIAHHAWYHGSGDDGLWPVDVAVAGAPHAPAAPSGGGPPVGGPAGGDVHAGGAAPGGTAGMAGMVGADGAGGAGGGCLTASGCCSGG